MGSKPLKGDDFIHLPEFPGGKNALQDFIRKNLIYPAAAIKKSTEGTVLVGFRIGYDGTVSELKVLKGIGDGCDEEALRVVKLLKFSQQNNRGVKLTTTRKMKINFKMPVKKPISTPDMQITYEIKKTTQPEMVQKPVTYSYMINIS